MRVYFHPIIYIAQLLLTHKPNPGMLDFPKLTNVSSLTSLSAHKCTSSGDTSLFCSCIVFLAGPRSDHCLALHFLCVSLFVFVCFFFFMCHMTSVCKLPEALCQLFDQPNCGAESRRGLLLSPFDISIGEKLREWWIGRVAEISTNIIFAITIHHQHHHHTRHHCRYHQHELMMEQWIETCSEDVHHHHCHRHHLQEWRIGRGLEDLHSTSARHRQGEATAHQVNLHIKGKE